MKKPAINMAASVRQRLMEIFFKTSGRSGLRHGLERNLDTSRWVEEASA